MDNYREDHKAVIDELVTGMPGVKLGKMFGYPAYKTGRKVFCFVGGEGVSLKLPPERVRELVDSGEAAFKVFEPTEGRVWASWLSIDRADSEAYRNDLALLQEAEQFVREQA